MLTPSGRLLRRSAHPEDRPAVFAADLNRLRHPAKRHLDKLPLQRRVLRLRPLPQYRLSHGDAVTVNDDGVTARLGLLVGDVLGQGAQGCKILRSAIPVNSRITLFELGVLWRLAVTYFAHSLLIPC